MDKEIFHPPPLHTHTLIEWVLIEKHKAPSGEGLLMLKSCRKPLQSQGNKCHSQRADMTLSGKETRFEEVLKKEKLLLYFIMEIVKTSRRGFL